MMFTAFITYYRLHDDGRWLTTGRLEMIPDLDRTALDKLVAERAAEGIQITANAYDDSLEASTEIGGRVLHWGGDGLLAAVPATSTSVN